MGIYQEQRRKFEEKECDHWIAGGMFMGALLSAVSGMTSPARANDARITHLEGTHGCFS
jgi:hypothetical protein